MAHTDVLSFWKPWTSARLLLSCFRPELTGKAIVLIIVYECALTGVDIMSAALQQQRLRAADCFVFCRI